MSEDNAVCIERLADRQFHWFYPEEESWQDVLDHFADPDGLQEYVVVDAEGPWAPIMKQLGAGSVFDIAEELMEHEDWHLAEYVTNVAGVSYFLENVAEVRENCEMAWAGVWESKEDYAEEVFLCEDIPKYVVPYIDWDAVLNDMDKGGDVTFVKLDQNSYLAFRRV